PPGATFGTVDSRLIDLVLACALQVVRACSTTLTRLKQGCPTPGPEARVSPSTTQSDQAGRPFVANIKSQIKRIKTNAKATERNRAHKAELRTSIRKFREAHASGDAAATQSALQAASRKLDKAVTNAVNHNNQAENKKSAMATMSASLCGCLQH